MKTLLLIPFILLLTSCNAVGEKFNAVVAEMVNNGSLTPEQATAVSQAFTAAAESGNWWEVPLNILGGAALAVLGVRSKLPVIGRGAPTQVVGLPSSKIKVAT